MTPNYQVIKSHFEQVDPIIHAVMKEMDFDDWLKPLDKSDDFFIRLTRAIISQQLAVKAAAAINTRFLELFPQQIVTPERILDLPDQVIRDVGLSWSKVAYIKDLSQKTVDDQINYAAIPTMSDEEVARELIQVKGIGQWTVDMFLMFNLGRPDHFSFGDLGLKRGLQKLYQLDASPTVDQINAIITPWSPYKSYGSFALWESLDNS